jgi:hypothetical protein
MDTAMNNFPDDFLNTIQTRKEPKMIEKQAIVPWMIINKGIHS